MTRARILTSLSRSRRSAGGIVAAVLLLTLAAAGCGDDTSSGVATDGAVGRDVGVGRDATATPDASGTTDAAPTDAAESPDAAGSDVVSVEIGGGDVVTVDIEQPDTPPVRGGVVTVEPPSVFFTYSGSGDRYDETISVANGSDVAVTLVRARLVDADPGFVIFDDPVNAALAPGGVYSFTLRFESTSATSASATLEIETATGQVLRVPVTAAEKAGGTEESPPCVSVVPRRIAFGRVVRGDGPPLARTFEVRNCGDSEIRLLRLDRANILFFPTPSNFQWTSAPLPLTISGGGVAEVTVTYEAGRAGVQTGGIDVRTNVPGSESVRVELSAESAPPAVEDLDVHLVLRWDQPSGSDVDFHFLEVGRTLFSCDDCYFANMSPDWGVVGSVVDDPFLDVDDLEGPGPENINVDELAPGEYRIVAHYYSDTGSGGGGDSGFSVATNATVEVYLGGTLAATYGPVRLNRTNDTWDVATLSWPSGVLTEVGTVGSPGTRGSCLGI